MKLKATATGTKHEGKYKLSAQPWPHKSLIGPRGAHVGYVDGNGRLFTVNGTESFAVKPNGKPNKSHLRRLIAAEEQYGKGDNA